MTQPPLRLGAVGYLNARPLTWDLDRAPGRWRVRYYVPSVCAAMLHADAVDLALVPSVEYLRDPEYRLVPGIGVASHGPVVSVALYARVPVGDVRRILLDTSSRTSVALVRVLCRHRFGIEPEFVSAEPHLSAMLERSDAALLIGDPALETDHAALGVTKIDLGEEWTQMTGLPFVYAAWTGRPGRVSDEDMEALRRARDRGVQAVDEIAREYGGADEAAIARAAAYLSHNVRHVLGPAELEGLQLFLDLAAEAGAAVRSRTLTFY